MALGGALGLGLGARDAAAFCVAGAASTVVLRGRRGTNSHLPSFCVAGVALMVLGGALGWDLSPVTPGAPRHFAWQAWHLVTSTLISRGMRGTNSHLPLFCVAGVAQTHIYRRFAWQAWHLWYWVAPLAGICRL